MHSFFLMLRLLLLIFCMDDLKYMASQGIFYFIFIYIIIKINYFLCWYLNIVAVLFCILSPHFHHKDMLLNAVLLTFSVNALCTSLLNLCCDLNVVLLFCRHFLKSSSLSLRFITHYFVPLASLSLFPPFIK